MGQSQRAPLRSLWRTLDDEALTDALVAARLCVDAFAQTTREHGSLIQSWVQGAAVVEYDHYPAGDVVDNVNGSQFYYHAHRHDRGEHGHLHLFWHATRAGRRSAVVPGRRRWVSTEPSHLFAISLDARGLPVGLFTPNLWVTDGHWFDAEATLRLVDRFCINVAGAHRSAGQWLTQFVRMYRVAVKALLAERDRRLQRARDPLRALQSHRLEILSHRLIDWSADLDALEAEAAWRVREGAAGMESATRTGVIV